MKEGFRMGSVAPDTLCPYRGMWPLGGNLVTSNFGNFS